MTTEVQGLALLRQPFPPNLISKLPKPTKAQTDAVKADFKKGTRCTVCGTWHHPDVVHLDYVGHAALTDRLLDADPAWSWEPLAISDVGLPVLDPYGGMWIRLTVCGVTRLGYGHAGTKEGGDAIKEVIGDALRNAAMRFGAALDLWHKGDLHAHVEDDKPEPKRVAHVPANHSVKPTEEVFNMLQPEEQDLCRKVAAEVLKSMPDMTKVLFTLEMAGLENDMKVGVWNLLDSKTRSAIKAAQAAREAAPAMVAGLPAVDGVAFSNKFDPQPRTGI